MIKGILRKISKKSPSVAAPFHLETCRTQPNNMPKIVPRMMETHEISKVLNAASNMEKKSDD